MKISDIENYATHLRSIKTEKKGGEEEEMIVPVIEEKLYVSKKVLTDEVTIIKEPVTETKTIDISIMHEAIVIEKRATASAAEDNAELLEDPPFAEYKNGDKDSINPRGSQDKEGTLC